ncbi:Hypothetical predicted protein, partial [Pelobates cultripes]
IVTAYTRPQKTTERRVNTCRIPQIQMATKSCKKLKQKMLQMHLTSATMLDMAGQDGADGPSSPTSISEVSDPAHSMADYSAPVTTATLKSLLADLKSTFHTDLMQIASDI